MQIAISVQFAYKAITHVTQPGLQQNCYFKYREIIETVRDYRDYRDYRDCQRMLETVLDCWRQSRDSQITVRDSQETAV